MSSPFPGMDPYLEGSEWGSFHIELSSAITRDLIPKLRPKYYARTMPNFIVDSDPEVSITRRRMAPDTAVTLEEPTPSWEGIQMAVVPAPVQLKTVVPTEIPHYVVHIYDKENRELVTALEVLSPANKRGQGYRQYVEKRELILQSEVHLIEIDWLRRGKRVPMLDPLPEAPYYVFLSRAETRPIVDVWPIQYTAKLPQIPIPLLHGDGDVSLDLQTVFTTVYAELDYASLLDYSRPPEIPFDPDDEALITQILQAAGIEYSPHETGA